MPGLEDLSDDDLKREIARRKPKSIRIREYEVTEEQYRRLHGRGPEDEDQGDEDEDEDEDERKRPAARRKSSGGKGGYFGG